MLGVPNSWSILQLGTSKGLVGHFPNFWRLVLMLLLINPRDLFPFAATLVTCVPADVVGEIHPKVPSTGHWCQYLAMEYTLSFKGGPGSSHMYNLALGGVKLHIPLRFPCLKSVQVSLQAVTVGLWFKRQLDVVGKETHLRNNVLGEVVDVGQEQNRPKDRALRHTRCHRDQVWFLTLNNDPLLAIA